MNAERKNWTFLAVYLTFFVDNLSWAIVFPIFAPYFLDVHNVLFSPEVDTATRTTLLGFCLMTFSFGQFLGAPLLGEYADKHGRKKALAISVFFTLVGLAFSAYSIQINHLPCLFISRFITGLFASNTTLCLSCTSDLSEDEKSKRKKFGYLAMSAGLSFILGAFLGGKLADKTLSSLFSFSVPLWIAAGLSLLNFLIVLFGFRETFIPHPDVKFHFLESFKNIKTALKTEKIKRIYTIYFLFLFSWTILFQFIPVLMIEKFSFTSSRIGDLAVFMGICWALGSGYINRKLAHRMNAMQILEFCLLGFAFLCFLIIFPTRIYGILGNIGLCVILGGLAWPICTSLISNTAPQEMQGKVLGLSQSVQSLAMSLAPAIAGIAFQSSIELPFILAAGAAALALILFHLVLKYR